METNTKNYIIDLAQTYRANLKSQYKTIPTPVKNILENELEFKIDVVNLSEEKQNDMIKIGEFIVTDENNFNIYIDKSLSNQEQQMILGYFLTIYKLKHEFYPIDLVKRIYKSIPEGKIIINESFAIHAFAYELLMPTKEFLRHEINLPIELEETEKVIALANIFNVPVNLARHQLMNIYHGVEPH